MIALQEFYGLVPKAEYVDHTIFAFKNVTIATCVDGSRQAGIISSPQHAKTFARLPPSHTCGSLSAFVGVKVPMRRTRLSFVA